MTTLADLRAEIRDICDVSGSSFHLDYDLNKYINRSLSKLQTMMINTFDSSYFIQTGSFDLSLVADQQDYDIAAMDYHKIVAVDYYDGSYRYNCLISPWGDRNDYQRIDSPYVYNNESQYAVTFFGNKIKVVPTPTSSNGSLKFWFIPNRVNLVSDSDSVNAEIPASYLDWVMYDVAIKIKIKAEEPIGEVKTMRDDVERLVREDAQNRITKQIRYAPDEDHQTDYPLHWRRY